MTSLGSIPGAAVSGAAVSSAAVSAGADAAGGQGQPTIDISVLVPVLNEAESVDELVNRVRDVLDGLGKSFEIVFIDDGSNDGTPDRVREQHEKDPRVRLVRFRRNFGKAAAISAGVEYSRGAIVVTMDGDLQDVPEEIPNFLEKLDDEDLDLVSGWKRDRQDPPSKRYPSKLFNWASLRVAQLNSFDG